jgi:hypothetical protein
VGLFDGALDAARPMFDQLKGELQATRAAIEADTTTDREQIETNAALTDAIEALTQQMSALQRSIVAANRLAAAKPKR